MIKYIAAFLIPLALLSSCGDDSSETIDGENDELVDNFTIEGAISGAGNTVFYLEAISQQGNINVAEVTSDGNGKFKMIGNIPGFGLYQLRLGQGNDKIIPVTLVPNDYLKVSDDFATFTTNPKMSGTKWAKVMNGYMAVFSTFHAEQAKLMQLRGKISDDELTEKFTALKAPVDAYAIKQMSKDPSNPFNLVLSSAATPSMGFEGWDANNLAVLQKVSEAFNATYKDSPMAATLANQVYQIELAYNDYRANNSGERVAPDISLSSPEGKTIKLSSLRGKYVLIDFWASWCAPCRQENPNVVKLYNKYKNKGFTVYSVSLDNDATKWKAAIAADGLVWPNHVSDLLQWNSPMPQLYGFDGIPHTVLINPEGKIIGTGLRGATLEQKLIELFEK